MGNIKITPGLRDALVTLIREGRTPKNRIAKNFDVCRQTLQAHIDKQKGDLLGLVRMNKPMYNLYEFDTIAREVKCDKALIQPDYNGERIEIYKKGDTVRLFSGNTLSETNTGMEVFTNEIRNIDHDFILDSELVDGGLYVNDIMRFDGIDLTNMPLTDRLDYLSNIKSSDNINVLPEKEPMDFVVNASDFSSAMKKAGTLPNSQGAVLKDVNSTYRKDNTDNPGWFNFTFTEDVVNMITKNDEVITNSDEVVTKDKDNVSNGKNGINGKIEKRVEKRGNKWCVVHGHPKKPGSKTDKPEGTPIKCFDTEAEAEAMHVAISISQHERNKEEKKSRIVQGLLDKLIKAEHAFTRDPQFHAPKYDEEEEDKKKKPKKDKKKSELDKLLDKVDSKIESQKDERAPKEWFDDMVGRLRSRGGVKDPEALANWIWHNVKKFKELSKDEMVEFAVNKDKKKKFKKTVCEQFEDIFSYLEGKETDKTIIVKKNFVTNFDLCLVSTKKIEKNEEDDISQEKIALKFKGNFKILNKSLEKLDEPEGEDLIIGGYASTEKIDAENESIDQDALQEAFKRWIKNKEFANIMVMHGNLQIGQPLEEVTIGDKIYKTKFNDKGLYLLSKIRNDNIEEVKRNRERILKNELNSYSIGGEALSEKKICNTTGRCINKIIKLDLWEVTLCKEGKNPDASFDVLKAPVAKALPENAQSLGDREPPKGAKVVTGPRGGKYIIPGAKDEDKKPKEDSEKDELGLKSPKPNMNEKVFGMSMNELMDMRSGQIARAVKNHVNETNKKRVAEGKPKKNIMDFEDLKETKRIYDVAVKRRKEIWNLTDNQPYGTKYYNEYKRMGELKNSLGAI